MRKRTGDQRALDFLPCQVGCMNNPMSRMAAFPAEIEHTITGRETNPKLH